MASVERPSEENDEELTIKEDLVVTKYKMGAEMVNAILVTLMKKCVAGASVLSLCEEGDKLLAEETSKVYKKEKEMKKGIAFPTCVSVNNCVCHFSPLKSDPDVILNDGDVVKIDLGAHIDGFIAVVAHTLVVGASEDNKVTGRKADVIMAAHLASEAAFRLVKPGNKNVPVTAAIQSVAESFECKPVEGMLSHQLKQHVIDGEKAIIQNPSESQNKKKPWVFDGEKNQAEESSKQWGHSKKDHEVCDFECFEVYAVDILVSSGEGKGRDNGETKTSVYKKKDAFYNLKMKASKQFLSEVHNKHNVMPFALRSMEDEKRARMGVKECLEHGLVEPFTVLWEKEGEFVAQFKFTVLLMPNGPLRITGVGCGGIDFDKDHFVTDKTVQDEEMKSLLAQSASRKAAKKKKKKAVQQVTDVAQPEQKLAAEQ